MLFTYIINFSRNTFDFIFRPVMIIAFSIDDPSPPLYRIPLLSVVSKVF
jgi:hypothetical protein